MIDSDLKTPMVYFFTERLKTNEIGKNSLVGIHDLSERVKRTGLADLLNSIEANNNDDNKKTFFARINSAEAIDLAEKYTRERLLLNTMTNILSIRETLEYLESNIIELKEEINYMANRLRSLQ